MVIDTWPSAMAVYNIVQILMHVLITEPISLAGAKTFASYLVNTSASTFPCADPGGDMPISAASVGATSAG